MRAVVYDLTGLPQESGHIDGEPDSDCQVEHSSSTSTAPCIAIKVLNLESQRSDRWVLRGPRAGDLIPLLERAQATLNIAWALEAPGAVSTAPERRAAAEYSATHPPSADEPINASHPLTA